VPSTVSANIGAARLRDFMKAYPQVSETEARERLKLAGWNA
jgi:hypothetical protein